MKYDLIGDIHGCSKTLLQLLQELEYSKDDNGTYFHPDRKVIFLGDFIDRGPHQREVIDIVRPMIDSGFAYSVMGNHEYNAICFATEKEISKAGSSVEYLRPHTDKNIKQHVQFLKAYSDIPFDAKRIYGSSEEFDKWFIKIAENADYQEDIAWFKTLPLWLEIDGVRVIHACWNERLMKVLGNCFIDDELVIASSTKNTDEFKALETLLKGVEVRLPEGEVFSDKEGTIRHHIRVRWWDQDAKTYQKAFLGPESARINIPEGPIDTDHLIDYRHDSPPVFLGHYWMNDKKPKPLAKNIACLDYSVAKPKGKLVAYRYHGESELHEDHYHLVERVDWPGFSDTGSIILPLSEDLFKSYKHELSLENMDFKIKKEFHITLLSTEIGIALELALQNNPRIYAELEKAYKQINWNNFELGEARLISRLKKASESTVQRQSSLILMVNIPGVDRFYHFLNEVGILHVSIPVPPLHVTLYTHNCDSGIGISDFDKLNEYSISKFSNEKIMSLFTL